MLIRDIMTKKVITVTSKTSVGDAQKLMKERNLRRLPVVDEGRLVGLVTLERLEQIKPKTNAPLLWQITYLLSRTIVGDVMRKDTITVKPTETVEQALDKAQKARVGTLIVVNRDQIVGICTTNDFFYKIVNPTLGLGESGTRILVSGKDIGHSAEKIISCINNLGIEIKVLWAIAATKGNNKEIVLHLETENTAKVIKGLEQLGCTAKVLAR
jgi:acetoin utilization protein AcuB